MVVHRRCTIYAVKVAYTNAIDIQFKFRDTGTVAVNYKVPEPLSLIVL